MEKGGGGGGIPYLYDPIRYNSVYFLIRIRLLSLCEIHLNDCRQRGSNTITRTTGLCSQSCEDYRGN